jgi:hypothetical protein
VSEISPEDLEGEALTSWYLRSPADIERERQAAAAKRYQDFFYGPSRSDPDSGFAREMPGMNGDLDPDFAVSIPSRSHDIDPGFTRVPAGPNRLLSIRLTSDSQTAGLLSLAPTSHGDATSPGEPGATAGYQDTSPLEISASEPDLTPQPTAAPDGQLTNPPTATFGSQSAAAQVTSQASSYGCAARPQTQPARPSAVGQGYQRRPPSQPGADRTIAYGALRAPAPTDQELAELRREQAAFAGATRKIDLQNSWFAVPALAPPLVALGLGAAGEWVTGEVAPKAGQAVLNFVQKDPYLRVGDNWATRAGRRAHAALRERLAQKEGWEYEPNLARPGQRPLKPDLGTPKRNPQLPDKRMYGELKPDSPSGRDAGARALKKYQALTDDYIKLFFYNLQDFI